MRSVVEYRKHAEECRKLAQQAAAPEDRRAFEEIAETWEFLANLRGREVEEQ